MGVHFGPGVTGQDAYDKAVRNEQGGGNVFGVRVRSAVTGAGPTNDAKRQSEFGVNVLEDAHASDETGKEGDTVSIESLRNILAENPTFLDSLYEGELAREDGARPDALHIFYEVERGIKGQMRPDVMAEMKSLLGQKGVDAEALANQGKVRREAQEQMKQRNEENALLADAPRIRDLKERSENLKIVKAAQDEGTSVQVGFSTEQQEARIAREQGIALPGQEDATAKGGSVPTKLDGPVHAETQSAGNRLGVPKGTEGGESGGSAAGGSRPAAGAGSGEGGEGGEGGSGGGNAVEPDDFTKGELEDALSKALGEEKFAKIKGTGSEGAVLKADLVKAAAKGLKDGSLTIKSGYIVASS